MSRLVSVVPLLAFVVGGAAEVGAQAWTQDAGHAYVKVAQSFSSASSRYDAGGTVVPYNENTNGSFRERSTYFYGELGVTDRLTAVVSLPYKRLYVTDETFEPTFERESSAWGTATVGARYDIGPSVGIAADDPTAFAVNFGIGLPMGYTRNYDPAVGPGQVDLKATLNIGRSLWPFPGYAQVGLGFRRRTGSFALSTATVCEAGLADAEGHACVPDESRQYGDELLLSAEGGATIGPVLLQGILDAHWSISPPAPPEESTVIQPEAFELQRYVLVGAGVTIYGPLDFGLSIQAFSALHAQNTLGGSLIFVGLERKF